MSGILGVPSGYPIPAAFVATGQLGVGQLPLQQRLHHRVAPRSSSTATSDADSALSAVVIATPDVTIGAVRRIGRPTAS